MTDLTNIVAGDELCPHFEDHTPCPTGYIQWHAWAEKMGKTHKSRKCSGCNLYVIWEPKAMTGAAKPTRLNTETGDE